MIEQVMSLLNKVEAEKYEETALELIKTILLSGGGAVVLERASELYARFGDHKLSELLLLAKDYLLQTASIPDSFYQAGLLTEETYQLLKSVEKNLSIDFINGLIEGKRLKTKTEREIKSMIKAPLVSVFIMGLVGAFMMSQMYQVVDAMGIQLSAFLQAILPVYRLAYEHTGLIGMLIGAFSVFMSYRIIMSKLDKSGMRELKLALTSLLVKNLIQQKFSYNQVFSLLSVTEKEKRFKEVFSEVADLSLTSSIKEAIVPFLELIPSTLAVSFISMLERGDEIGAWGYLYENLKEQFKNKIVEFKEFVPAIPNGMLFLVMVFSMLPIFGVFPKLMSMFGGTPAVK